MKTHYAYTVLRYVHDTTSGEFVNVGVVLYSREARYASAFSFKYSPRPGTPASGMAGQVDEAVKAERLARLQALLDEQQVTFNAACEGRTLPVLFEKLGRHDGQLIGRSPYLQSVYVEDAISLMGEIVPVKITASGNNSLQGALRAPVES